LVLSLSVFQIACAPQKFFKQRNLLKKFLFRLMGTFKFSTFNQGCATTFMRSPLVVIAKNNQMRAKRKKQTVDESKKEKATKGKSSRKSTSEIKSEKKKSNSRTKSKRKSKKNRKELQYIDAYSVLTPEELKLLEHHQTLKLQIELVPKSCWWSNVRSNLTDKQWDGIRKPIYLKASFRCEICGECGTKHPVECHEIWVYDDINLIQKLQSFQALCPLCHEVKHIGRAGILGNGKRAFERFRKINGLTIKTAKIMEAAVSRQWGIRTMKEWKLDIEYLKEHGLNPEELKDRRNRQNNYH
jgi:5-methylcytosine-specific restriction endonuclease McrA